MVTNHIFLVVFWLFFGLIHSVLAIISIKKHLIAAIKVKETTYRILYNAVAIFTLFLVLFYQTSIKSWLLFVPSTIIYILSAVLIISGIVVMAVCMKKYFKQMAGLQEEIPTLEIYGIHKYIRHPLYLGTFLFIIGIFLAFPLFSNFIGVSMIIIYTLIGIQFEERKLIKTFGKSYLDYKSKVPMIVPLNLKNR